MTEAEKIEQLEQRIDGILRVTDLGVRMAKLEKEIDRWRWIVFTVVPAVLLVFGITAFNYKQKIDDLLQTKKIDDLMNVISQSAATATAASEKCQQDAFDADIKVKQLKESPAILDGSTISLENLYAKDENKDRWLRLNDGKYSGLDSHAAAGDTGAAGGKEPNQNRDDYEIWKIHVNKLQ